MTLKDLARSAAHEIAAHKLRSALTCLSLSFGVAAMLFTFSTVEGMNRRLSNWLALAGPGRIQVNKKRGYASKGRSPGLTWEDVKAIRREVPDLYMIHPMVRRWQARISYPGFSNKDLVVWGTTDEWRKRDWVYKTRGRFFNEEDVRAAARVCVLFEPGGWVVKPFWAKYFPEQALERQVKRRDLLGTKIKLEDHLFTVIGVLQEPPRDKDPRWGHSSYGGSGNVVVPVTSFQRYLLPQWEKGAAGKVDEIEIDTGDEKTVGTALRRIKAVLAFRHRGEPDYEVKDYREIVAGRMKRMRERAMTVLAIGIVAILAGGIGIMNVTLATIFSRIREIGIRRALGATRADIVFQFVTEAVSLGVLAGAAGTGLGFAAVKYLAPDADIMAPLGPLHLGWALVIAMGTGFLFSLFPAYQAARFDPVESLRYE